MVGFPNNHGVFLVKMIILGVPLFKETAKCPTAVHLFSSIAFYLQLLFFGFRKHIIFSTQVSEKHSFFDATALTVKWLGFHRNFQRQPNVAG